MSQSLNFLKPELMVHVHTDITFLNY